MELLLQTALQSHSVFPFFSRVACLSLLFLKMLQGQCIDFLICLTAFRSFVGEGANNMPTGPMDLQEMMSV